MDPRETRSNIILFLAVLHGKLKPLKDSQIGRFWHKVVDWKTSNRISHRGPEAMYEKVLLMD